MNLPAFNAESTLYKAQETHWLSQAVPGGRLLILPQLGIDGGGITYPPGGDDCYCCLQWVRCPCGLSLG